MVYSMTNQQLRKYYVYAGDLVIKFSRECAYKSNDNGCEYETNTLAFGNWYHVKTNNWYCKTHAIKLVEIGQIKKESK